MIYWTWNFSISPPKAVSLMEILPVVKSPPTKVSIMEMLPVVKTRTQLNNCNRLNNLQRTAVVKPFNCFLQAVIEEYIQYNLNQHMYVHFDVFKH